MFTRVREKLRSSCTKRQSLPSSSLQSEKPTAFIPNGESECLDQLRVSVSMLSVIRQEKSYVEKSLVFDVSGRPLVVAGGGPGCPESRSVRRLFVGWWEFSWSECLSYGKRHEAVGNRGRLQWSLWQ